MIISFKCKETQKIFDGKKSKRFANIQSSAKRKLDMLHYSVCEKDLTIPPNNGFEHLKGNLSQYCSIRINNQFRIIFMFIDGNAYDVQIIDYHK